jgi:(p)ppGpp synthase/HD superfamily hydrolase
MTNEPKPKWIPGPRFEDAVAYAIRAHAHQARKGGTIPYLAHLFAVAAHVMEDGGSEDETIAAMLHDAGEDQGGEPRMSDIEARFGSNIATIVRGCSDTLETPKPDWGERKRRYVEHLADASLEVRRVSLADKVHNAESMVSDHTVDGEKLWERFNAKRDDQATYYRSLRAAFRASGAGRPLFARLDAAVEKLFGD